MLRLVCVAGFLLAGAAGIAGQSQGKAEPASPAIQALTNGQPNLILPPPPEVPTPGANAPPPAPPPPPLARTFWVQGSLTAQARFQDALRSLPAGRITAIRVTATDSGNAANFNQQVELYVYSPQVFLKSQAGATDIWVTTDGANVTVRIVKKAEVVTRPITFRVEIDVTS